VISGFSASPRAARQPSITPVNPGTGGFRWHALGPDPAGLFENPFTCFFVHPLRIQRLLVRTRYWLQVRRNPHNRIVGGRGRPPDQTDGTDQIHEIMASNVET
jgi:hypothetical protein